MAINSDAKWSTRYSFSLTKVMWKLFTLGLVFSVNLVFAATPIYPPSLTEDNYYTGSNNFSGPLMQNGVAVLTNGAVGPQGIPGTNGINGINGTNGASGINGTNGTNGINGTNGVNGINGTNGATGSTGSSGGVGATGPAGPAGIPSPLTNDLNAAGFSITNLNNINSTGTVSGAHSGNGSGLTNLTGANVVGNIPGNATTATTATSLAGEGTIAMTNAANQTGLTFALGVLKFWATNVVVGSFTNANGGLGASNLFLNGTLRVGTSNNTTDAAEFRTANGQSVQILSDGANGVKFNVPGIGGANEYLLLNGVAGTYISGGGSVRIYCPPNSGAITVYNPLQINAALAVTGSGTFSGTGTFTNGVINYGTGWSGTTNATAPASSIVIVGWVNYTNTAGGLFKMPLYQ